MVNDANRGEGSVQPLATDLRVLFVSLREPEYVRNAVSLRSLRLAGARVTVCSSGARSYAVRILSVCPRLLLHLLRPGRHDLVFVGFLGHPLVLLARILTRKPVIFDAFLSVFDTLCLDRRRFRPEGLVGRLSKWLDTRACALADLVLIDTEAHARFFERELCVEPGKVHVVRVGADETHFYPAPGNPRPRTAFYYSTGLGLHGMTTVLAAARLLEADGIHLRIGGAIGTTDDVPMQLPTNVAAIGWQSLAELAQEMRQATVGLAGHFSTSAKAARVIPGKAYQFLAIRRPVVLSRTPGNLEIFHDGNAAFHEAGDETSLAEAIRRLVDDPVTAEQIAIAGHNTYQALCSPRVLATQMSGLLGTAMVARNRKPMPAANA